jgi:Protein of unknown function (DUF2946)
MFGRAPSGQGTVGAPDSKADGRPIGTCLTLNLLRVPPQLTRGVWRSRTAAISSMRMQVQRVSCVLTSWIAMLAILMSALAPSISHAVAPKQSDAWVEVCTSAGAKWVKQNAGSSEQAPASDGGHAFEHCPYCSLHANAIAIPAAPFVPALGATLSDLLPIAFLAAPRTLHAWVTAQPRAPPQLS